MPITTKLLALLALVGTLAGCAELGIHATAPDLPPIYVPSSD